MSNLFLMPNYIVSGENSLEDSGKYIYKLGKKAFIVTGKAMSKPKNMTLLTNVLDAFNIKYVIYDKVSHEPSDIIVNDALALYKETTCDFLIALGGGSPIDTMKAVGLMKNNEGKISDYMGKTIPNAPPPMVAIPTTAGTGSEVTSYAIINDTKNNVKMVISDEKLVPDLAILNHHFSFSVPKEITASTGLDALTHAIESYTSRKSQPLSEVLALSAIKRIFEYLPIAYNNPMDSLARSQMMLASLEAGISFNNSSVTLIHGMSRPIGALYHVPHGISNAMLLEKCLKFIYNGCIDKFAIMGREINNNLICDEESYAISFINEISSLCKKISIPTLREYGIDEDDFMHNIDKMANDALASGSPANTIKEISKQDIINIYKSLWKQKSS